VTFSLPSGRMKVEESVGASTIAIARAYSLSASLTSACSRSGATMSNVHARTPAQATAPDPRVLGLGLPEEELQDRFDALQRKLVSQWELIEGFTTDPYGFVVVPSLSGVAPPLDSTQRQAYEERYLFLLFLLRQPHAEIVYVTSEPIQPNVVDYYLGLLPGVVPSHARRRLHLLSPHDGGPAPLSA
jgi:hypothetical protein